MLSIIKHSTATTTTTSTRRSLKNIQKGSSLSGVAANTLFLSIYETPLGKIPSSLQKFPINVKPFILEKTNTSTNTVPFFFSSIDHHQHHQNYHKISSSSVDNNVKHKGSPSSSYSPPIHHQANTNNNTSRINHLHHQQPSSFSSTLTDLDVSLIQVQSPLNIAECLFNSSVFPKNKNIKNNNNDDDAIQTTLVGNKRQITELQKLENNLIQTLKTINILSQRDNLGKQQQETEMIKSCKDQLSILVNDFIFDKTNSPNYIPILISTLIKEIFPYNQDLAHFVFEEYIQLSMTSSADSNIDVTTSASSYNTDRGNIHSQRSMNDDNNNHQLFNRPFHTLIQLHCKNGNISKADEYLNIMEDFNLPITMSTVKPIILSCSSSHTDYALYILQKYIYNRYLRPDQSTLKTASVTAANRASSSAVVVIEFPVKIWIKVIQLCFDSKKIKIANLLITEMLQYHQRTNSNLSHQAVQFLIQKTTGPKELSQLLNQIIQFKGSFNSALSQETLIKQVFHIFSNTKPHPSLKNSNSSGKAQQYALMYLNKLHQSNFKIKSQTIQTLLKLVYDPSFIISTLEMAQSYHRDHHHQSSVNNVELERLLKVALSLLERRDFISFSRILQIASESDLIFSTKTTASCLEFLAKSDETSSLNYLYHKALSQSLLINQITTKIEDGCIDRGLHLTEQFISGLDIQSPDIQQAFVESIASRSPTHASRMFEDLFHVNCKSILEKNGHISHSQKQQNSSESMIRCFEIIKPLLSCLSFKHQQIGSVPILAPLSTNTFQVFKLLLSTSSSHLQSKQRIQSDHVQQEIQKSVYSFLKRYYVARISWLKKHERFSREQLMDWKFLSERYASSFMEQFELVQHDGDIKLALDSFERDFCFDGEEAK